MHGLDFEKVENILLEAGILSRDKPEGTQSTCLTDEKEIEKLLLSEEIIKYREVLELMARKMGVGYIDLENINISKKAVEIINKTVARKYLVFPFDIRDNLLYLAMQNPDDIFLIDEIKVYTQMEIKPFLADFRLIGKAIDSFYPLDPDEPSAIGKDIEEDEFVSALASHIGKKVTAPVSAPSNEIEKAIMYVVKGYLIKENITDICFNPAERTMTITLKARY